MVTLLRMQAAVVRYPGASTPALDGVELTVETGQLVCLLGPNGAGKSSLLRAACGLVAFEGEVEVGGRALADWSARERARAVALVPQGLSAPLDTTVASFVRAGRYAHETRWTGTDDEDRRAVAEALERVHASDWGPRLVTELSGGQFQRVLIARALAQEAPLLLVDEPTTALDPTHQVATFRLLRTLVDGGASAIVATHELSLASAFADRLVLLERGRVRCAGQADEVVRAEHLAAVWGADLWTGRAPVDEHVRGPAVDRPFALPWPRAQEPADEGAEAPKSPPEDRAT